MMRISKTAEAKSCLKVPVDTIEMGSLVRRFALGFKELGRQVNISSDLLEQAPSGVLPIGLAPEPPT
jgi:hypothetical protein